MGQRSRDSLQRAEQDVLRAIVQSARTRAGLTAKELSLKLNQSHSFISRIERGSRTLDVVEFVDIARALGIEPKELFRLFLDGVAPKKDR